MRFAQGTAPVRGRTNIDGDLDLLAEVSEPDLRSQVEYKFVEMTEAHDRIRKQFLKSHDGNNEADDLFLRSEEISNVSNWR
jgi:hypothetical protein